MCQGAGEAKTTPGPSPGQGLIPGRNSYVQGLIRRYLHANYRSRTNGNEQFMLTMNRDEAHVMALSLSRNQGDHQDGDHDLQRK